MPFAPDERPEVAFDFFDYPEGEETWGIPTTFVYVIGAEDEGPIKIGRIAEAQRQLDEQLGKPSQPPRGTRFEEEYQSALDKLRDLEGTHVVMGEKNQR